MTSSALGAAPTASCPVSRIRASTGDGPPPLHRNTCMACFNEAPVMHVHPGCPAAADGAPFGICATAALRVANVDLQAATRALPGHGSSCKPKDSLKPNCSCRGCSYQASVASDCAERHAGEADLAICLGTSLQITPACNLPLYTVKAGICVLLAAGWKCPLHFTSAAVSGDVCLSVCGSICCKQGRFIKLVFLS